MRGKLSEGTKRVQGVLNAHGIDAEVAELPQSTRTAKEAAKAVGCGVGQIAKSIVFRTCDSQKPILVIASGPNRINEEKISELVSEPIEKADADFVKRVTGFPIGGVAPVGHLRQPQVFIDEDLFQYSEIWAAAGTPHAVFKLRPRELERITGGRVVPVK